MKFFKRTQTIKMQEAGNLDSATKVNADGGKIGIFKRINGTIGFGVMQLVSRYMVPPDAQVSNYLHQTPVLNPSIATAPANPEYTVSVIQQNGKAVYDISYNLAQMPGWETGKNISHGVENFAQKLVENAASYGFGAAIGILFSTVGLGAFGGYWLDRSVHKLHIYVSKYPGDATVKTIADAFVSKQSDIDAKTGERVIAQSQAVIEAERTKLIESEKASFKFKLSDIASGDEFTKKYDPVYSETDGSGNLVTSNYYPMIAKKLKQMDAELKKIADADPILKASYTASPTPPKIFKAIIDKYGGGSPSGVVTQLNNAIENRINAATADMSKTISSYSKLISGTTALDPALKPLQEYLKDASKAKAFYESFGQKLMAVSSADKTKPTPGEIVLEKFALTMYEQVPKLNPLYATSAELVQDLKDMGFAPGDVPKMGRFTWKNATEFLTKPWKEKDKHFVRKALVMLIAIGIISVVASAVFPKKEEPKTDGQKTAQTSKPKAYAPQAQMATAIQIQPVTKNTPIGGMAASTEKNEYVVKVKIEARPPKTNVFIFPNDAQHPENPAGCPTLAIVGNKLGGGNFLEKNGIPSWWIDIPNEPLTAELHVNYSDKTFYVKYKTSSGKEGSTKPYGYGAVAGDVDYKLGGAYMAIASPGK